MYVTFQENKMDKIIREDQEVRYVVRVNGAEVSPRYTTPQAADAAIQLLSEAHQSIAEVVPITMSGQQVLLG
jgi:hypothetical protein